MELETLGFHIENTGDNMLSIIEVLKKWFGIKDTISEPISEGLVTKEIDLKEVEKKYLTRIHNLEKEAIEVMDKVKKLELVDDITKTERDRLVNYAIRRLTFIKHEIEIRDEVLNGFNIKRVQ